MTMQIRAAAPSDAEVCGRIIYEAFDGIAGDHGFPPDFPSAAVAIGLAEALISDPTVFGVVAVVDGEIAGSNFMMERDAIRAIGPITVSPRVQGAGVGRRLMEAALERANGARGVRLLQDAFNMRSLALYASLGFDVREPVVVMTGRPSANPAAAATVRPMVEADLASCDRLCTETHGVSRRAETAAALGGLSPMVAERDGRITAYMTAPSSWILNHGVAETEEDMRSLIAGVASAAAPVSFLLPTRQSALLRWCLSRGMKAVKPMTLMTMGDYRPTERPYLPSVFY